MIEDYYWDSSNAMEICTCITIEILKDGGILINKL